MNAFKDNNGKYRMSDKSSMVLMALIFCATAGLGFLVFTKTPIFGGKSNFGGQSWLTTNAGDSTESTKTTKSTGQTYKVPTPYGSIEFFTEPEKAKVVITKSVVGQGSQKSQTALVFNTPVFNAKLQSQDGKYIFTDPAFKREFVYTVDDKGGLKEDIILHSAPLGSAGGFLPFRVETQGLVADITPQGEVSLINADGLVEYTLQKPWAKDAQGKENHSFYYKVDAVGDKLIDLSLVLDRQWLDEPARAYPVTIDPTVTYIGTPLNYSQISQYCPPGNTEGNCAQDQQPAPVAEYYFDDASGGTVADSSGNTYTGTWSGAGAHWTTQGKQNFAGTFNGTDDFVDVGAGPTSVKSIGFWVYPASTTEYFVDLNGSAYVWANSGVVTATGFTGPTIYVNGLPTTAITAGVWSYIMVTSATAVNASDLDFGRLEGTDYYQGRLDHVRMYNYVRTAAQVAWDFNLGQPVAWYKLNEGTGTAVSDWGVTGQGYRGNGLTLTIGGTGLYTTTTAAWAAGDPGRIHTAIALDGTDDYLASANVALMAPNASTYTNISWGAWVKPLNNISRTILYKNTEFSLKLTAFGAPSCEVYSGGAWKTPATSPYVMPVSSWSHVMCTYDGANIKIYVNGLLKVTQPQTGAITSSSSTAVYVGATSAGAEYFEGLLDDVRIYPYALSASQTKVAKNDGIASYGRQPVTAEQTQSLVCQAFAVGHVASGGVAPVDKTVTYGTVLSGLGGTGDKCWITQNLGSTNQASAVSDSTEASAGWYWQFNRIQGFKHDGTTRTPATTWDATNDNTYAGWDPAKDPCTLELGAGWRMPTYTEYYNMDNDNNWTTWLGPWNSALKLHAAGYLNSSTGALTFRGSRGYYWSSAQYDGTNGRSLYFTSGYSYMVSNTKALGFSVRCLRTP